MFCFTKSTRSMNAINNLLTNGFCEDALILGRSAYECYLNAAFILTNQDRINDVVAAKIGVYFGKFEHPVSQKGRELTHRIIHPETGKEVKFGIGFNELAENSFRKTDKNYHTVLYSFLSEFVHVHMISSGSFRSDTNESYDPNINCSGIYQSILLCAFVSWLNLDAALHYLESANLVNEEMSSQLQNGATNLENHFKQSEFKTETKKFESYAIERLWEK